MLTAEGRDEGKYELTVTRVVTFYWKVCECFLALSAKFKGAYSTERKKCVCMCVLSC
jgi:hypothetical protein